jgi:hypothetical protein
MSGFESVLPRESRSAWLRGHDGIVGELAQAAGMKIFITGTVKKPMKSTEHMKEASRTGKLRQEEGFE